MFLIIVVVEYLNVVSPLQTRRYKVADKDNNPFVFIAKGMVLPEVDKYAIRRVW